MKYFTLFFIFCMTFCTINEAAGQRSRTKKETTSFSDNLYMGIGVGNIGIGSSNGYGNVQLGFTPFVGYRFNEYLSAGPLVKFTYTYAWNNGLSESFVDYGLLGYFRAMFFNRLILQTEAGFQSFNRILQGSKSRINTPVAFVGLGWNWGRYNSGQEIMFLYDVSGNLNKNLIFPFEYRLAFTFDF